MGLEVSEIEGDAILFYKFCDSPDLADLPMFARQRKSHSLCQQLRL
ncbi:DUF2652 domain-containing protein [Niastella populi]